MIPLFIRWYQVDPTPAVIITIRLGTIVLKMSKELLQNIFHQAVPSTDQVFKIRVDLETSV